VKARYCICFIFLCSLVLPVKANSLWPEGQGQFSVALGLGHYDSLTLSGSDQHFYMMPRWSWYQGDFYIENLDLGVNLYENSSFSLDLTTKQSLDALMFKGASSENSFIKGIALANYPLNLPWDSSPEESLEINERSLSYLGGFSFFYRANAWQLSSSWHQDISRVHDGSEWSTEGRYLLEQRQFSAAFTLGTRLLSANYANYYFGIPAEQTLHSFQFKPGQSWLNSVRLELAYQLQPKQRILVSIKREWLPDDLLKSYMLKSTTHDIWFVGYSWSW
jgi:outer membrane scaffolding protein for murein synthesis (MipA/OmpV family)